MVIKCGFRESTQLILRHCSDLTRASLIAQLVQNLPTMREWRRQWHPTPVLLPGKSHGRRSLVGYSPWGHKESDTTERLHVHVHVPCYDKCVCVFREDGVRPKGSLLSSQREAPSARAFWTPPWGGAGRVPRVPLDHGFPRRGGLANRSVGQPGSDASRAARWPPRSSGSRHGRLGPSAGRRLSRAPQLLSDFKVESGAACICS